MRVLIKFKGATNFVFDFWSGSDDDDDADGGDETKTPKTYYVLCARVEWMFN